MPFDYIERYIGTLLLYFVARYGEGGGVVHKDQERKIMMILITIYFVNLFVLGQNFGQSNSVEKLSTFSSLVWEVKSDTVTY